MVLRFRVILLILAATLPIWAQQTAPSAETVRLQIRGRVVEFGSSLGLSDAQITLERWDGPAVSSFVKRTQAGTAKTDVGGSFVFELDRPGAYRLTVTKDDYGKPGGSADRRNWTSTDIAVNAERPIGEVRFSLARPGEVTGSVVDEDTQKPVGGLRVTLLEYSFSRGRVSFSSSSAAVTNADGRFVFREVVPTDYVIALPPLIRSARLLAENPTIIGEVQRLTDFSEKDLETIDRDYDWSYWLGGHDAESVFPFTVGSGARVEVGRLTIRKVPKFRLRISLQSGPCLPEERFRVSIRRSHLTPYPSVEQVPCGQEALIRGFAPGSYRLEVSSRTGKRGTMLFNVVDRNIVITVPVTPGVDLGGKVLFPEGANVAELESMQVLLRPIGTYLHNLPGKPDVNGRFKMENVSAREFQLLISGIPKTHYLKEIRYNGNRVTGDILAVDGGARTQSLELLLDDKPAAVGGMVTENDRPVSRPYAVLVKSPPNRRDLFASVSRTEGDERGRFQFAGVAPGEYRIVAVSAEDRWNLERPGVLLRLLERADEVTLGERQYQNVNLKLAKP